LTGNGVNSYQAIAGGWGGQAVQQIVGRPTTLWQPLSLTSLVSAWNAGQFLTLGSKGTSDTMIDGNGVVQRHAYVVVGYNATTQRFTVFNPWGMNNGSAPDLLTLSITQIQQSFSSFDRVSAAARGSDASGAALAPLLAGPAQPTLQGKAAADELFSNRAAAQALSAAASAAPRHDAADQLALSLSQPAAKKDESLVLDLSAIAA
jgi:hypothetical protein